MDKFLRVLVCVGLSGAALSLSSSASATIEVTITDITTTISSGNPRAGFWLSKTSASGDDVMPLLNCSTTTPPPCTIFFPSGLERKTTGDTFMFQDAPLARIEKYDSGAPRLELKGIQITALPDGAGKTLTVSFRTTDFTPLDEDEEHPGSSTYPTAAYYKGTFTTVAGGSVHADQCHDPNSTIPANDLMNFCSKLLLKGNGTTALGSGAMQLATVSVPCQDYSGSVSPCKGDIYLPSGKFDRSQRGEITCPYPCTPDQEEAVTSTFKADRQTLALTNSAIVAMARQTVENFGVEELYHSLAGKLAKPIWVSFAASEELYRTKPPSKEGKTVELSIPIAFDLLRGRYTNDKPISLTSMIASKEKGGDDMLPSRERFRNDRSYVSFIATPKLPFNSVESLILTYKIGLGFEPSPPDRRLTGVQFSDCSDSAFYVRINLIDELNNKDVGHLVVNLGQADLFKSHCAEAKLSGQDLFGDVAPRVDASPLGGPKSITLKEARAKYGKHFVRSISVVADQSKTAPANFRVDLSEALVKLSGGSQFKASTFWDVVDPASFEPVTGLPPDGVSMVFSRFDLAPATPVYVVKNDQIERVGSQFRANVPANKLPSDPNPTAKFTKYRIDLCLSGGRCIPDQGTLTLWK